MSAVLREILNETLQDLTKRLKDSQASIERAQAELDEAQESTKGLEKIQKCKKYEDEQVRQKIEVLKAYLNRFDSEKRPLALVEKMEKLVVEQARTGDAWDRAGGTVDDAHNSLKNKRNNLGMLKQEHGSLQKQWDEITELITQERENI